MGPRTVSSSPLRTPWGHSLIRWISVPPWDSLQPLLREWTLGAIWTEFEFWHWNLLAVWVSDLLPLSFVSSSIKGGSNSSYLIGFCENSVWTCMQSTLHNVCLHKVPINSHHCYCCEVGDRQGRWVRRRGRFPLGRARDGWLTLFVGDMYSGISFLTLDGDILMHWSFQWSVRAETLYSLASWEKGWKCNLLLKPKSCSLSRVLGLVGRLSPALSSPVLFSTSCFPEPKGRILAPKQNLKGWGLLVVFATPKP